MHGNRTLHKFAKSILQHLGEDIYQHYKLLVHSNGNVLLKTMVTTNCSFMIPCNQVFCFNFVTWVDWWSSTRETSQIWLYLKEESNFFRNATLFWIPPTFRNLCWNMMTSKLFSSKCGDFGGFFSQKTLCTLRIIVPLYPLYPLNSNRIIAHLVCLP
jgi:hypothetical protein